MNLTIDLSLLINPTLDQCLESIPIKTIIPFPSWLPGQAMMFVNKNPINSHSIPLGVMLDLAG